MAQQTLLGHTRAAIRREKKKVGTKNVLLSAQKRFAHTLQMGTPAQMAATAVTIGLLAFAQLPGGLYPMATAAFAACVLHAFCVPAAFAGCAAAVISGFDVTNYLNWWQLSACAAIWLAVPCRRRKEGALWWAMLSCGAASALPTLMIGAASFEQAMVCMINAAAAIVMTPVFERALLAVRHGRRVKRPDDRLCLVLCICAGVLGMRSIKWIGPWMAGATSAAAVVWAARARRRGGDALIASAVLGGIMALDGGIELPCLFTGALLCALPGVPKGKAKILLFFMGIEIGGVIAARQAREWAEMMPILIGAAVGTLVRPTLISKVFMLFEEDDQETQMQSSAASVRTAVMLHMWAQYVKGIAASLPKMECDSQEAAQAEALAQCLCESCERKRECWNDRFEVTRKYMFKLLEAADTAEPSAVIEQAKLLGCINAHKLEALLTKQRCQNALRKEEEARCQERRTLSAIQLQGTAQVLEGLSERFFAQIQPDDASYRRAQDEIARRGMRAKVLYAVEVKGRKEMMMIRTGNATAEELRRVADIACGMPMQPSAYETLAKTEVLFEQSARLDVDFYAVCRKKDGESVAGDGYIARPLSGGRYLLALSDGMGSGEQAHRESQATLHLLWQCLCAGYTRSQALLAVNGILLSCAGAEIFATMDLCLIDLHTGEAAFEKLGACTSYVVREKECIPISADTLPMGVLSRVEPRSVRMHLIEGDVLVMLSDGIADYFPEGENGLRSMLSKRYGEQPQAICDTVLSRTLHGCADAAADDMTVICARIQTAQNSW